MSLESLLELGSVMVHLVPYLSFMDSLEMRSVSRVVSENVDAFRLPFTLQCIYETEYNLKRFGQCVIGMRPSLKESLHRVELRISLPNSNAADLLANFPDDFWLTFSKLIIHIGSSYRGTEKLPEFLDLRPYHVHLYITCFFYVHNVGINIWDTLLSKASRIRVEFIQRNLHIFEHFDSFVEKIEALYLYTGIHGDELMAPKLADWVKQNANIRIIFKRKYRNHMFTFYRENDSDDEGYSSGYIGMHCGSALRPQVDMFQDSDLRRVLHRLAGLYQCPCILADMFANQNSRSARSVYEGSLYEYLKHLRLRISPFQFAQPE